MKRALLVSCTLIVLSLSLISCGSSSSSNQPPSRLGTRVLVSQGVSSPTASPGLLMINGAKDTPARVGEISAGTSPSFMALSPTRTTLLVYDSSNNSNSVQVVNTGTESSTGKVQLTGSSSSMVIPVVTSIGYAAVASAQMNGFSPGAIEVMNLSSGAISDIIGVPNAQTVVANANGAQLLVFGNDRDTVSIVSPLLAAPPVDTGCDLQPSTTCTVVNGFDRPVYGFFASDGSTAYILNCGQECGGTGTGGKGASIQVLHLTSPPTVDSPIPLDGATMGFVSGSTLYVAGTSPSNNGCAGQTTAATTCGRLSVVALASTPTVTGTVVIPDGYHDHMDMSSNRQLFIGSHSCMEIGNANNPSGEVRGCLAIFDTTKAGNTTAVIPPDSGDVTGLQSFATRSVEYVIQGGNLRIYDTTKDVLQKTQLTITGKAFDVKAIDFF